MKILTKVLKKPIKIKSKNLKEFLQLIQKLKYQEILSEALQDLQKIYNTFINKIIYIIILTKLNFIDIM